MLRTNSIKARENVAAYILQDVDYLEESYEMNVETVRDVLAYVYTVFRGEFGGDRRILVLGEYELFREWARGLALGGLFLYYYNRSAVNDLGDILEETEAERARYTEEQAEELLTRLIYREVVKAYNNTAM